MTLKEVIRRLSLKVCTDLWNDAEVTGGYCSDMLSDVLAWARKGDLWFTVHTHVNIVPAGLVAGVAGIVVTGGRRPEAGTLKKAKEEGIVILQTERSSFEIAGELYCLLKKQKSKETKVSLEEILSK